MGWLYPYHTHHRRDLIADLVGPETGKQGDGTVVRRVTMRHCCVGNVLWVVQNWVVDATDEPTGGVYIVCNLMQKHGTWGYKDMGEESGPNYYTCPEAYLELVPPPKHSKWALGWRKEVRAYHEGRRARAKARRELRKAVSAV